MPTYSNWWSLADKKCEKMSISETMVKIICRSSGLKSDHYEYKDKSLLERSCNRCNSLEEENIFHLVMQCEANSDKRRNMFADMKEYTYLDICEIFKNEPLFYTVLGKPIAGVCAVDMYRLWSISREWIRRMYNEKVKERNVIG